MKLVRLLLALTVLFPVARAAQPLLTHTPFCATCGIWGADTFESESGQFVVHGWPGPKFPPAFLDTNAPVLVQLEPQLVAVTAERVRRALFKEIGAANNYRGKVHVILLDAARPDQPIGIISHSYNDGFVYQVGIPTFVEHKRLIKALVQVLLLEFANRGSTRCAELPSWLVEGFTRDILSTVVPASVFNSQPITREIIGYDRLSNSRAFFQTNTPMTIQEVSFQSANAIAPGERERFESSAHLLVYDLLRVREGPRLMAAFLQTLPRIYNWQTALFSVYRAYFRTPLDLEKWWMLHWLEVKNQQKPRIWPVGLSLQRLDAMLQTAMELRVRTNEIPQRPEANLQELIYATDFGVHKPILEQKLQQIFFLSVNLSPEVRVLANRYEQAIQSYLKRRQVSAYQPGLRTAPEQRIELLVQSTVKLLDRLDKARDALKGRVRQ